MSKIGALIKELAKTNDELYSQVCTVTSVDKSARTVNVEPINGDPELFDVMLQADIDLSQGICPIPKEGSYVIVTFLTSSTAFVSLCTEIEEVIIDAEQITINGGDNKGLIIVDQLQAEIQKLNTNFDVLVQAITSAPVTPADGGSSFKAGLIAGLQFQKADVTGTTNEKVKH
jgi:exosome complex RNA-binding protein Csl4